MIMLRNNRIGIELIVRNWALSRIKVAQLRAPKPFSASC
jgi:hypothetical protein